MCGGKGTRIKSHLNIDVEKPLIKIKEKPLVEYLINTLVQTDRFEKIFAAVSSNTRRTQEYLNDHFQKKITLLETSGTGYSKDYMEIIKYFKSIWSEKNIAHQRILFLPVDMPLISSMLIVQILDTCQKKPCLAVVLEKDYIQNHGLLPTNYEFILNKKRCCYSGISIIDTSKIDVCFNDKKKVPLLDEEYLILNHLEMACNINTLDDLEIVRKILENTGSK